MQPDAAPHSAAPQSAAPHSAAPHSAAPQDVRDRLLQAGPAAVQFLTDALCNEELSYKERIDIAKDLLNRGFGKTLLPETEEVPLPAEGLRIELAPEVAAYAD